MTNKELRKALLEKLRISPQALSQQCKKLKTQIPRTTGEAVYVIAQRNNIVLDRYLDQETIRRVRALYQQLMPTIQTSVQRKQEKIGGIVVKKRVIKIGKDVEFDDPLLPSRKAVEASEMAGVYPLIYVFENSIRELIGKVMIAEYGKDWWDTQVPKALREHVSDRMADDKKNSWHQRRGDRTIDYLDLKDLPRLMTKIEKFVVPDIISSLEWFRQLVEEVYKSRCVVCHMNPLDKDNIKLVELRFNQWEKQISAKQDLIP